MKRDTLWSVALLVVFFAFPMWLDSTEPADAMVKSWWTMVLGTGTGLALVAGLVLVPVAVVKAFLPRGIVHGVAQIERVQFLTAIAATLFATALILAMATTYPELAAPYAALALAYALWCLPISGRRLQYRIQIVVRCSRQAAFEMVSNPRNWHSFLPQVKVEEPLEQPLRLGSLIRQIWRLDGQVVRDDETVIAFEPERRFGTASVHRRPTDVVYELSSLEDGTSIVLTYWGELTYSQALLGLRLRRRAVVRRAMERRAVSLKEIKRLLESLVPAAGALTAGSAG